MIITISSSTDMAWNDKIREARLKSGLSQQEVADALGISQNAISRYENGTNYPEIDNLLKLCALLRCGLDWLFDDARTESIDDDRMIRDLLRRVKGRAVNRLMGLPDGDYPTPAAADLVAERDQLDLDRALLRQAKRHNKRADAPQSEPLAKLAGPGLPAAGGRPDQGEFDQVPAASLQDERPAKPKGKR